MAAAHTPAPPPSATDRPPHAAWWPVTRAVLIAAVIVVGLVDGCPVPDRNKTAPWAQRYVEEVRQARASFRTVTRPIAEGAEIYQRWTLFRGASRKRFRVWIEGRPATGDWQILYRADDPDHAWDAEVLEYRRIRGSYNPYGQNTRQSYRLFAAWMLERVLARRPEMVEARIRLERIRIQPRGGFIPTGEFTFEHSRLRGKS